jgi:DNA-binding beta-propeller fold protein YncE
VLLVLAAASVMPVEGRAPGGTYRLVENWAQLPPGTTWGVITAVGTDVKDNVYVFQRSDPTSKVMVFDGRGKYLRTWGEGAFTYPHGLRVLRDGFIWIADRQMQQVLKYDAEGQFIMSLGQKGIAGDNNSTDKFNGASDIVTAANGDIFVSDGEGGNSRIVKFSKEGKFIKSWGTKGAGHGELSTPHNIAMDSKGRVWVCDRGNKRLQVFDQNGKYLEEMTQFGAPAAIFITKDDVMFVAASEPENRVTIGTTDGKVLETIDGLNYPHGITVDSSGAIYVAESFGKAVLKFVKQ